MTNEKTTDIDKFFTLRGGEKVIGLRQGAAPTRIWSLVDLYRWIRTEYAQLLRMADAVPIRRVPRPDGSQEFYLEGGWTFDEVARKHVDGDIWIETGPRWPMHGTARRLGGRPPEARMEYWRPTASRARRSA